VFLCILNNEAIAAHGAGIWTGPGSSLELLKTQVLHNENKTGDFGGGIASGDSAVIIKASTIANNTAGDGGGLYSQPGSVTIQDSYVTGNKAVSGGGGGINLRGGGKSGMKYVVIRDNEALVGDGGGIFVDVNSLTVRSSTVHHKTSKSDPGCEYKLLFMGTYNKKTDTMQWHATTTACGTSQGVLAGFAYLTRETE